MRIRLLFTLLILLTQHKVFAQDTAFVTNMHQAHEILNQLIARSFPEFKPEQVTLTPYKDEGYFFQTNFVFRTVFKHPLHIKIKIDTSIFKLNCPVAAFEAVLAHELCHGVDYQRLKGVKIIKILPYAISKKFRKNIEHQTDIAAINKGYKEGLIAYKLWLYPLLNEEQLKWKKYYYLTPEEINNK